MLDVVFHPLPKVSNNNMKVSTDLTKAQDPIVQAFEVHPPIPVPPESRRATSVMVSTTRSICTILFGGTRYVSRLANDGNCVSGSFECSIYITCSPVFEQRYPG